MLRRIWWLTKAVVLLLTTDEHELLLISSVSTTASCCPLVIFSLGRITVLPRRWRRDDEALKADVKLISSWAGPVGLTSMSANSPAGGERQKWRDRWRGVMGGNSPVSKDSDAAGRLGLRGNTNWGRLALVRPVTVVSILLLTESSFMASRCDRHVTSIKSFFLLLSPPSPFFFLLSCPSFLVDELDSRTWGSSISSPTMAPLRVAHTESLTVWLHKDGWVPEYLCPLSTACWANDRRRLDID